MPPPATPDITGATATYAGNQIGTVNVETFYVLNNLKTAGNTVLNIVGDVTLVLTGDLAVSGNA